jgi:hypothetical protein
MTRSVNTFKPGAIASAKTLMHSLHSLPNTGGTFLSSNAFLSDSDPDRGVWADIADARPQSLIAISLLFSTLALFISFSRDIDRVEQHVVVQCERYRGRTKGYWYKPRSIRGAVTQSAGNSPNFPVGKMKHYSGDGEKIKPRQLYHRCLAQFIRATHKTSTPILHSAWG